MAKKDKQELSPYHEKKNFNFSHILYQKNDYVATLTINRPEVLNCMKFSDDVQAEDIEICELVQRGLSSRSYDKGRFSVKRENAVYHFQCLLKQAFSAA